MLENAGKFIEMNFKIPKYERREKFGRKSHSIVWGFFKIIRK